MERTAERVEFLSDVLVTAIENFGYGWFTVHEYDIDTWTATIEDSETEIKYDVDLDTIARGIGVIKAAKPAQFAVSGYSIDRQDMIDTALANAEGERLYLGDDERRTIMEASRDNDAGNIDVILALAILECAIFGQVTYC